MKKEKQMWNGKNKAKKGARRKTEGRFLNVQRHMSQPRSSHPWNVQTNLIWRDGPLNYPEYINTFARIMWEPIVYLLVFFLIPPK